MNLTRRQRMGLRYSIKQPEQKKKKTKPHDGARGREIGKQAEKLFLDAWNSNTAYPPWLKLVRAATQEEDTLQKTDAVMTTVEGKDIRIQIKYGRIKGRRRKLYRLNVVSVRVRLSHTAQQIRTSTLKEIATYEEFLIQQKGDKQGPQ